MVPDCSVGMVRSASAADGVGLAKTSMEFCGSVLIARLPSALVVSFPLVPDMSL
ncbi:Uncharacterised protein [Mycobacteroides abscessus]|nr:Uncharacterised protein [Mycobacteroides abscessus]